MIQPPLLSRWILDHEDIWQLNFLDPGGLQSFIDDRSVDFWKDHIIHLWKLGWVRADIVRGMVDPGATKIELIGGNKDDGFLFSDNRDLGQAPLAPDELPDEPGELDHEVTPYFHPFKLFTFWQIRRIIRLNIHPYQMFIPSRYPDMVTNQIDFFYQRVETEAVRKAIHRWDEITTLAIATEPCFFYSIIGSLKYPPYSSAEEQIARIEAHRELLKEYYLAIGLESLKEILQELCVSAEMVEPNKNVNSLMRFVAGRERMRIKGQLGGAIILKTMAEIIRRMSEWVFDVELPEEDEMGFGIWVKDARKKMFGSNRIFDTKNLLAKRQYIRNFGLDTEVRVRIYVEGLTEYNAFNYLLANFQQIEIINLSGHFIQGKGKGLSFRENLILDDRSGIFSLILLDSDRNDNIRVVKTAAQDDIFCGQIYISNPDFEFENFTIHELIEIVWNKVDESEKTEDQNKTLFTALCDQKNGGSFLNAATKSISSLNQLGKGRDWGESLAAYASQKPEIEGTKTRQFVEAFQTAIRAINVDYQQNKMNSKVDPESGKLIPR